MNNKLDINVPLNVNKVLRRLKRFDYQAYLVGGCVRDTLLGITPKDWDVATDATPEEIRYVFDNSRIVGRRFPIVHVCFYQEVVEVVTLRGSDEEYGTLTDDVHRRDFTVNALYWDDGEIIDPFSGLEDIESKLVVCIGEPEVRFTEDPVRMLRAVRLVQQGLTLPAELKSIIKRNSTLLATVNKSRLYYEFNNVLTRGCQSNTVLALKGLSLFQQFFPRRMYSDVEYSGSDWSACSVICDTVWDYYQDLVGACVNDFSLHPIPASQKAAKLLVEALRQHMDVDNNTSREIKEELHQRYRAECA